MFNTTSNLWNELNDQQAEKACGGAGSDVVNLVNPQKSNAGLNYGQFLKGIGLNAKELNDLGGDNPASIGLGTIISGAATS